MMPWRQWVFAVRADLPAHLALELTDNDLHWAAAELMKVADPKRTSGLAAVRLSARLRPKVIVIAPRQPLAAAKATARSNPGGA